MSKRPELMILNGDLAGKRYQIGPGGLRLGRSSSNDIHLSDEELSRNHCLFEAIGEDGLRVTDLASANGTVVNDAPLGDEPTFLKAGDVIEVGQTRLKVVGDEPEPAPGPVDLGFGTPDGAAPDKPAAERRRSPFANLLWGVVVVLAVAAAYLALVPTEAPTAAQPASVEESEPTVQEMYYEKVEASAEGIFRYELRLGSDGVLRVTVDDVPKENRHLNKSSPLGEAARKTLNEILPFKVLKDIDREYAGAEPDVPKHESWTLRVVYDTRARSVRIVNTQEPEAFRAIREKLEAFSKNELGVWAIQYSRDKLVALAEESLSLGRAKFEDRDANYGNLWAAIAAYRETMFYLETVDPKPPCHAAAREGYETAKAELDRRYADQRFLANRATKLGQWDVARRELSVLMEMIPDRDDDRYREAAATLMDVEKRMKKGGK